GDVYKRQAYDYAVLGETLPVVRKPRVVLREMLRVAKEGIVSFPNFGSLCHRLRMFFRGRMPRDRSLPFEWYDAPHIHLFSLGDFVSLCRKAKIRILEIVCLTTGLWDRFLVQCGLRNLGAQCVIVRITAEDGLGIRKQS
ncbi:MAG: methionine biosynthesis protein MetW, partial [Kiritimatiellae bacterium]|nr:methionine biosynthesis protein MetW [Kiritimatiellia bacterium]